MGIKMPSWHRRQLRTASCPGSPDSTHPADLRIKRPGDAKAETVETIVDRILVAGGRTQVLLIVVPRPAANHVAAAIAAGFGCAVGRGCGVGAVAVFGPFPDIPQHIVKPECIGQLLADLMSPAARIRRVPRVFREFGFVIAKGET